VQLGKAAFERGEVQLQHPAVVGEVSLHRSAVDQSLLERQKFAHLDCLCGERLEMDAQIIPRADARSESEVEPVVVEDRFLGPPRDAPERARADFVTRDGFERVLELAPPDQTPIGSPNVVENPVGLAAVASQVTVEVSEKVGAEIHAGLQVVRRRE
jgi:hypothetical protein